MTSTLIASPEMRTRVAVTPVASALEKQLFAGYFPGIHHEDMPYIEDWPELAQRGIKLILELKKKKDLSKDKAERARLKTEALEVFKVIGNELDSSDRTRVKGVAESLVDYVLIPKIEEALSRSSS